MTTPILCATDLSETSRPALNEALRLASSLRAPLSVLFVAPPPYPNPDYLSLAASNQAVLETTAERLRSVTQARLEDMVQGAKCALGLEHVPTRAVVREGTPAETILREAEAEQAELIVVGTHARTGLPHLLLGSVAERVIRTARQPVLTVAPWSRSG